MQAGFRSGRSQFQVAISPELAKDLSKNPVADGLVHITRGDGDGRLNYSDDVAHERDRQPARFVSVGVRLVWLFRRQGHFDKSVAVGTGDIDGRHDLLEVFLYMRPAVGPQDDKSDFSFFQVLLVSQILICGDYQVEMGFRGGSQQNPVFQFLSFEIRRSDHLMPSPLKKLAHTYRHVLIKQYAHCDGTVQRK